MSPPVPPPLPSLKTSSINQTLDPSKRPESYPQIGAREVCQRLLDDVPHAAVLSWYSEVEPVMQEGPSCGLAAFCMASQLLNTPRIALNDALNHAKSKGFTLLGEMFSASNMCALVDVMTRCEAELVTDGLKNRNKIVAHLSRGQPILVPYDADKNNEPCCQKGHKAHWAVLTGVVLVLPASYSHLCSSCSPDPVYKTFFQIESNSVSEDRVLELLAGADAVYVHVRQGKSSRPHLWNYDSLALSNANLTEFSPARREHIEQYVLPEEGVNGGLCQQVVLIKSITDRV